MEDLPAALDDVEAGKGAKLGESGVTFLGDSATHVELMPEKKAVDPTTSLVRRLLHGEDEQPSASEVSSDSDKTADGKRALCLSLIMILVGTAATTAFLVLGVTSANRDIDLRFSKTVNQVVSATRGGWAAFEGGALWIHEACRPTSDNPANPVLGETKICTRGDFAELTRYLEADGLDFEAVIFAPHVNDTLRRNFEMESLQYYQQNYPNILYLGFTGLEPVEDEESEYEFTIRSQQPDYLPVHYVEPVMTNQVFVGFDLLSLDERSRFDNRAVLESYQPLVSERIGPAQQLPPEIIVEGSYKPNEYYIILIHPGIPLPDQSGTPSVASLILSANSITKSSLQTLGINEDVTVYMFDTTYTSTRPNYLGQASTRPENESVKSTLDIHDPDKEPALEDYVSLSRCSVEATPVLQKTWTIVVCHNSGYDPDLLYPVLGSASIMIATFLLALRFYSSQ